MKSIYLFIVFITFTLNVFSQDVFIDYHENGNISERGVKFDGKLSGNYTSYFKTGKIKTNEKYVEGIVIKKNEYSEAGFMIQSAYIINGSSKMQVYIYSKSGKIKSKGFENINGLKTGIWYFYDENDMPVKTLTYNDGLLFKN